MKILNLVIYSNSSPIHNENYELMQEILEQYYNIFNENVKTVFITYDKDLDSDYKIINNFLYFKGEENYVPAILTKTINAIKILYDDSYDYIIRTNTSTIIDFNNLITELTENPIILYGGGTKMILEWIAEYAGIVDSTYFGTEFITGTSIVLSKLGVKLLLDNINDIKYNIIDDVSFGIFFKEKSNIPIKEFNKVLIVPPYLYYIPPNNIKATILNEINRNKYIVYRNRCYNNRNVDVIQMKIITELLLDKYKFV